LSPLGHPRPYRRCRLRGAGRRHAGQDLLSPVFLLPHGLTDPSSRLSRHFVSRRRNQAGARFIPRTAVAPPTKRL
jgi:hypothetical protein